MIKRFLITLAALGLLLGCSPKIIYLPGETITQYRDSIVTQIDSVAVPVPIEIIKEVAPSLDTLRMEITNATSVSWLDTNTNSLQGTLKSRGNFTAKVEKVIEYHYRDSIQKEHYPVEVEVPVKYVPWYAKFLAVFGIIAIVLGLVWIALKVGLRK